MNILEETSMKENDYTEWHGEYTEEHRVDTLKTFGHQRGGIERTGFLFPEDQKMNKIIRLTDI